MQCSVYTQNRVVVCFYVQRTPVMDCLKQLPLDMSASGGCVRSEVSTENIQYAEHCSQQSGFSNEQDKQRSLPSRNLDSNGG